MLPEPLLTTAAKIIRLYKAKKRMVALAESCTGGLIAAALTSIPGSSAVLERGFVTYSNKSKAQELGVAPALLKKHGAVSKEVAEAMAAGALKAAKTDVALSVTGIAGPDGGSKQKPVGLVYIGFATSKKVSSRRYVFKGNREAVRKQAMIKTLEWLLKA